MRFFRITLLFALTAASLATSLAFFSPQPAFADVSSDADSYCNREYPTYSRSSQDTDGQYEQKRQERSAQQRSCTRGYIRGDGSGNTCNNLVADNFVAQNFAVAARDACFNGYNAKVAAENEPPEDTSGPEPEEKLGPKPTNADIDTMPSDKPSEHMTCGVSGFFGEILCGITLFGARIADASFDMLRIFLEVEPFTMLDSAGNTSATYTAWSLFRGVANAFFVIAFLMVIYSHLTGAGLSNYSVKRMIPRLVVAALLINLSFYISSLMVDLSNIVGTTLADIMRGISNSAFAADGTPVQPSNTFEQVGGSVLLASTAAVAAGAALLYAGLPVLLPVLASALVALVTTVLTLMLRQVLIIVFIILSPLAFAAILLPNTSQFFDKWKSAFIPILMVFPAISLLYGAGYIASISIQRTAAANGDIILQIMSLGVMIMPLFMIPAVMKLGGGLLNRIGGITNTPGAALRKKAEDRAEKMSKKRDFKALNRNMSDPSNTPLGNARAKARTNRMARDAKNKRIEQTRDIAGTAHLRSAIDDNTETWTSARGLTKEPITKGQALQQAMAQSNNKEEMGRAKNHVLHEKIKAHARDVEAKAIADRNADDGSDPRSTRDQLMAKALADMDSESNTVTALEKEAAILQLARSGDMGALLGLVKGSYTMNDQQRQTLVNTIRSTGAGTKSLPFLGNQESLDNIMQGRVNESNFGAMVVAPSLNQDDYSGATYTDMDQDAATEIANELGLALNGDYSNVSQEKLREHELAAYSALSNPDTAGRMAAGRKDIRRIADKHIAEEEALLEGRLRDMDNRPEEPW